MSNEIQAPAGGEATPAAGAGRLRVRRPGPVLALILTVQTMLILDTSVVNIALPKIQDSLGFTPTGLSWVLNAYLLAFGGLLLLGGRAGDLLGHRKGLVVGVGVFTAASLLGGLATSSQWLLAARTLQGVGAAFAAPTVLALITTHFTDEAARAKAFGAYAAVSGSGAALGLVAGGILTDWLSWRWVLFINVPVGLAVIVLAPLLVNDTPRSSGRFDLLGALTSTVGTTALVYGFIRAADQGWGDGPTLGSFALASSCSPPS